MMERTVATCIDAASSLAGTIETVVLWLAFWTAVVLPMVYLPPLLLGHPAVVDPPVLGTLVSVNVAAIVVGHRHGQDRPGDYGDSG